MSEKLEEKMIKAALNNSSPEDTMTPIQIIKSRRARLYQARDELKQEFIGLDDVIDKIIGQITVWYVMPEILTRPVIVCLWGMTGVGKTDFVRRLSRKLEMTNSFFEIQMSAKKSASMNPYGSSSIKDALNYSNLEPGKKGMLLLDEIQRFRTVDENGKDIRDVDSQDLWMLLSDGKFAGTTDKEDIFKIIFSDFYYYLPNDDDEDEEGVVAAIAGDDLPVANKKSKKSKKFGYQTPYRDAKSLRKLLRLEDSIEDIMRWPRDKKMAVAMERMKDQALYEGDNYANLLVFVSGNLDEAFKMSGSVGDMDTDADILHQFSKRINLLTIKERLKERFKPEQIARFGNNHIIYPSMSANSYSELIKRQLDDIRSKIVELHGIRIRFDDSVNKFIYRNGVIPAQGTRPVFSTIGGCIENAVPNFLLKAIETGSTSIDVSHENHKLIGKIIGTSTETHSLPCEGSIDKIKNDNDDPNHKAIVSVHEAGHAVIYALLTGLSPTQICAKTASESSGGFVGLHSQTGTRQNYKDRIAICLGGRAAELIVFRGENVTTGAESDIDSATEYAVDYVRTHGFGKFKNSMIPITSTNSINQDIRIEDATEDVRGLVAVGQKRAEELLSRNIGLFRKTSELLFSEGKISPSRFVDLCKEYNVEIRELDPKKTVYPKVIQDFESFISRR